MDELGNGDWSFVLWFGLVLYTVVGTVAGIVAALVSSFVIEKFRQSNAAYEVVRVFPWK